MELEQRFNELYQQNADAIFRLCLFKVSNKEVALDLSQDIFAKTWAYLVKGNEVDNLRAFLFTVARNRIKDYYKKRKTITLQQANIDSVDDMLVTDSNSSDFAEISELLELIKTLPPEHAELLQLRYVEELPIEEIALIYNVRPNTLAVKIHRILAKIRINL